jgi:diacylglycerol kinase family enzyme
MRGLLILNPQATTTSPRVSEVIVAALAADLNLEVVVTSHRGHAGELGARAVTEGLDIVVTLGGDGTVNETVNGMLAARDATPVSDNSGDTTMSMADRLPILAPVPGGSANVFARALQLPQDPVSAAGEILAALRENSIQTIGLGTVDVTQADGTRAATRWFLANAGLGFDAEIIEAMEAQRAAGTTATPGRYLRTTLRKFFRATDRRTPVLTLSRAGQDPVEGVFIAIVQNTSPWTYLGTWAIDACPHASFETGIDLFALRSMGLPASLRTAGRLLRRSPAGSTRGSITVWHDQVSFTVTATRPTPAQADGESLGSVTRADFASHPRALRTVLPLP